LLGGNGIFPHRNVHFNGQQRIYQSSLHFLEVHVRMDAQSEHLSQEDFDLSRVEELESLRYWLTSKGYPMGSSVAQGVLVALGCVSLKDLAALEEKDFEKKNLHLPERRAIFKELSEKSAKFLLGQPSTASTAVQSLALATPHEWIYVIACEHSCFYVGRTRKNPTERFEEHRRGQGSQWTKLHKPLSFHVPPRPPRMIHDVGLEEDVETKYWMKRMGVPFVRGGSYAQPELSREHENVLMRELCHDAEVCIRCGRSDHYVATCSASTRVTGEFITAIGGTIPSMAAGRSMTDLRERGSGYQAYSCENERGDCRWSKGEKCSGNGGTGRASNSYAVAECEECFRDISNSPKGHRLCRQCYMSCNSAVGKKTDNVFTSGKNKGNNVTSHGKESGTRGNFKIYGKAMKSSSSSSSAQRGGRTKSEDASGAKTRVSTNRKWSKKRKADWDY